MTIVLLPAIVLLSAINSKKMMYRLVIAVALMMLFSGCIDIYIDIFQHPDGTFTVRKMPALSHELIDMLASLSTIGDSTKPKTPPQDIIDTIKQQLAWERESVEHLPGILSYDLRDSTHDSTTYIISEIRLKDAQALSRQITPFLAAIDGKKKDPNSDDSKPVINVTTKNGTIGVDMHFTASTKKKTEIDKEVVKNMFKDHYFYLRVFSTNLLQPYDKHLTVINSGVQWQLPLADLTDVKAMKTKAIRFKMKESH